MVVKCSAGAVVAGGVLGKQEVTASSTWVAWLWVEMSLELEKYSKMFSY